MGADAAAAAARQSAASDERLARFAKLMRQRYGARLYLFGSRARGSAAADSDYDIVAVSPAFAAERRIERARDRYRLWRESGGAKIGLDLHCYTPEEYRAELAGLGFLGQAKRRGELVRIVRRSPTPRPRTSSNTRPPAAPSSAA